MSNLVVVIKSDNDRNSCINLVLESLMIQTYRPNKVIFWNYPPENYSVFNILCNMYNIDNDEIIIDKLNILDKSIKDFDIIIGISSRDILNINFLKYHKDILEKNNCITSSITSEFIDHGLCHFYPNLNRIEDITWNREEPFIYTYDSVSLDNFGITRNLLKDVNYIDSKFFLTCKKNLIPCLTHKHLHKIMIPKNIS